MHATSPGEGQGATFVVVLPLAIVHAPRTGEQVHPRWSRPVAVRGQPLSLKGVKVLVVDDEPDARDLMGRLLEDRGAEVLRCACAGEALDVVVRYAPDVLVSDIGLPTIDGYDLMRQLRARPALEGGALPAIALTAFARSEDRTRSLLAGYQLHVAKPVEPSELIASVATRAGVANISSDREEENDAEV